MTTTENPAGRLYIPARDLRPGDVITMGTIKTATPVTNEDGTGYMSIRFETRIGEHGTAFSFDLPVWVQSRTVPPATLNDVVTALTELTDQWEQTAVRLDKTRERAFQDGNDIITERADAGVTWLKGCTAEVRAILARLQ
jgi:hypothetical protein